ncbi:hypothetical protein KIW84_014834 [Lathyrus oleraceus]|uniref:Uncharacterized protein n=1 Tax=Pisum sativum TaxID=3888 RepID=A0A9D5BP41_PEA|nr:hypothetical protein KIW84_014834 [Pisum sativum]
MLAKALFQVYMVFQFLSPFSSSNFAYVSSQLIALFSSFHGISFNTLKSAHDRIEEQDQVDSILEGLPKECNPFVMHNYGCTTPPTLCDVEALLYVQEAQIDKFRQEMDTSNVAANVAHTSQEGNISIGAYSFHRGRGRFIRGCSRGRD